MKKKKKLEHDGEMKSRHSTRDVSQSKSAAEGVRYQKNFSGLFRNP